MYGIHPIEVIRAVETRRALDSMRAEAGRMPRAELEERVRRYESHQQDLRGKGFFQRLLSRAPTPIILGVGENSQPHAYTIAKEVLAGN